MTTRLEGLSIGLDLDSLRLERGLPGLKDKLKSLNSEMKANMSAFDRSDRSIGKYETRLQGLNKKLTVQRQITKEAKAEYQKMVREHGEGSKQAEKAAREYNNQAAALNNLERYVAGATDELKKMKEQQRIAESGWGKLADKFQSVGSRLTRVGDSMKGMGRSMSMYVTAPIAGIGGAAIKTGVDFQEGMSKVSAISGATGKDFKALEKQARDLGAKTQFSAKEASDGMQYLALAGFKTKDIMSAMPGMLDLAAAGALDLGRAADITSDTMQAFGMKADQAGHAADVFAYAQANANTNVEQMGEAMKYAAPVTNALGWSLEETSSAMMVLANSGLKGSIAGQAFASSLARLAKPTKQMKNVMDKTGMSFFDAEGKMKSMPEVMKEIEKGTKGMTQKQRSATITTLFGAEAYKHWAILLEAGSDELKTMTGNLENADGTAAKMAKTMTDNAKGDIKIFLSALQELSLQIYDIVEPALRGMIQSFTGIVEWTQKLPKLLKLAAVVIAGLVASIGPLLVVGGTLLTLLGNTMTTLEPLMKRIAKAGGLLKWLRLGFAALTGPIGLTIGAITLLGTGFIIAYKKFEPFRNVVNGVKDAFVKAYQSIKQFLTTNEHVLRFAGMIKTAFQTTVKVIGALFKGVSKIIAYHFKELKQVFRLYADFGKTIFNAFKAIFKGDFKKGFSLFKDAFVNAFQGALDIIKGRLNFFDDLIGKTIRGWIGKFGEWIDGIRKKSAIFDAVIGGISKTFSNYIADFKAVFSTLTDHFKSYVAGWKSIFKGDFKGAFVHFKDGIINLFKGLITIVKNRMSQIKTDVIESVKTWGPAFVKWIGNSAKSLGSGFRKWGAASLSWIKNLKDNTIEKLSGWKKAIIDWIAGKAKDIGEGFKNWKETFSSNFSESKDAILSWMDTLPGLIKAKLVKWKGAFTEWLEDQMKENKRQYGEWKDQLFGWIKSTGKNIGEKFDTWKVSIKDWFKKFPGSGSNGFSFKDWFKKIGQSVVDWKDKLIEKFNTWKDGIKDWFKGLGKEPEAEKAGKEIVKNVVKGATGKKKDWTENIGKIIVDGLKYLLIAVAVIALSVGREIIKRIISGITAMKGKFDEILGKLLEALKKKLGEMVKSTVEKWNNIKVKTSEFLSKWRENFSNVVKKIVDFVKKRFSGMGESTKNIFNKIRDLTKIIWEGVKKRIIDPVKSAVDTAKSRFSAARESTRIIFNKIKEIAKSAWDAIRKRIIDPVKSAVDTTKIRFSNARDNIRNIFNKIKDIAKASWDSIRKRMVDPVKTAVSNIRERFTTMRQTISDIFKKTKDKVGDYVSKMVQTVKDMPGRMKKGIQDMSYKVYDGMKGLANKMVKGLGKGVNGVIKGVNWVLGKLHVKNKLKKWDVPQYAKGTDGHPEDGPAIVGDGKGSNAGEELIQTPDGQTYLSPPKPTLVNLPKGTHVWSALETKSILGDVPHYAKGTLKDKLFSVWDYIKKPGKLLNIALEKVGVTKPDNADLFGKIARGGFNMVKEKAVDFIKDKFKNAFSFGEGIGGNIKQWVAQAIAIAGVPASWAGPLATIAKKESGGNPRAINLWDINAKRGIPSMGLMQTIMPTFQAYKKKGFDNIFNPVHNILAAIGYIKKRYGNVFNVPGIRNMARGLPYVGYETGGLIKNTGLYKLAEGGWPEYVIPTDPSRRTDAMKLLALAGRDIGNKRPHQLPDVGEKDTGYQEFINAILEQNQYLQRTNEILMQLLNKDATIKIGDYEFKNYASKQVNSGLDEISNKQMRAWGGA